MKLTANVSGNEAKLVIYLALLAITFLLCKEFIDVALAWLNGSFQSFGPNINVPQ